MPAAFRYPAQCSNALASPATALSPSAMRTHGDVMVIFKCPYCRAEYEVTKAPLAFQRRSYAKCQVCYRTMYSWNSRSVPLFTLVNASGSKTSGVKP
jgi:predicted Zn finger-like uncharacterized protein